MRTVLSDAVVTMLRSQPFLKRRKVEVCFAECAQSELPVLEVRVQGLVKAIEEGLIVVEKHTPRELLHRASDPTLLQSPFVIQFRKNLDIQDIQRLTNAAFDKFRSIAWVS